MLHAWQEGECIMSRKMPRDFPHHVGHGLEILDVAGMRRADALTIERGTAGIALMEKAGEAVADAAARLLQPSQRVLVLCGPGNNGGDGWVAARLLRQRGWPVTLASMVDATALKGDAAQAAQRHEGRVVSLAHLLERGDEALEGFDLVIDALFGAGLDRPLQGEAAAIAALVNTARRHGRLRVLAVDVPSGLHGDTGRPPQGGLAIAADATITFFRRKPAHLLLPGRDLCGKVEVADIGIPATVLEEIAPAAWENAPALWRDALPCPDAASHKYVRGSLVVLSGDALHGGAARLAAMAALRTGAGVVSLAGSREALLMQAAHLTEVMLDEADDAPALLEVLKRKRADAVIIGPAAGVNERTREMTLAVLQRIRRLPVVLDADVFSVFADAPELLFEAIAGRRGAVVMTPHEGEFARLFPDLAFDRDSLKSKLQRAKEAAQRAGCHLLLKGADTIVAAPDGETALIEAGGPPWLATAGSGDVLAGIIGALLAQGMDALQATAAAAWLHARAAQRIGPALIASDLPPAAAALLHELLPHGIP